MSFWDQARWDVGTWEGGLPPGVVWGDDWRWWYQLGHPGGAGYRVVDITGLVVEARWSTDSHTLGDGTFRGDIQPGTLTVRLWDPGRTLDPVDKNGHLWAFYKPTGAAWCWFYETFARGLFAPGDPQAADCVWTGSPWGNRFTTLRSDTSFVVQSVTNRLAAVAGRMSASSTTMPNITSSVDSQAQQMTATAADATSGGYPSYLQCIRDAAAPGVAWLAANGAAAGPGTLTVTYRRWDVNNQRTLDRSQIIAGPPVTAAADYPVEIVQWQATTSAGVQTTDIYTNPNANDYGWQGPGVMRLWGDVSASGAEHAAAHATAIQLVNDRASPNEKVLDTVDVQSGPRTGPTGGPAPSTWDPYAHVFSPVDVVAIDDGSGTVTKYRVTKSDHRLTALVWQTTHTLEKYTAPAALPP